MAGNISFNNIFSEKLSCGLYEYYSRDKCIYIIRTKTCLGGPSLYIIHGYEEEIQHVLLVLQEAFNTLREYKVLFKSKANNLQTALDFLKTERILIEENAHIEITLPHLKMLKLHDVWNAFEVIPEEISERLFKHLLIKRRI